MTQPFPSLKEAFENLCREFNIDPEPQKIEELIGLWNKSWMLAQPYPEIETTLKKLRKKYPLILISNTDCFSVDQVLEKFQLKKLFDDVFLSYQLGVIKTDKNFLKHVLTKLNLAPQDCYLIGDSIQSDIIPAKRIGLNAILIDRKNNRNFHPKIKNLNDIEKIL
jgi:HAD superfamily hydrolase (TIGR01549 family)